MAEAPTKKRAGDLEQLQIRRIGHRHAVITPARETSLVDMNRTRVELEQADEIIRQLERKLVAARARRESIARVLAAFDAQSVDRLDDDPVVPLEAPVPEPPQPVGERRRTAPVPGEPTGPVRAG